nr:MAG TPA: hypothetical protein [Caudoviricetes sp.]
MLSFGDRNFQVIISKKKNLENYTDCTDCALV